MAEYNGHRSWNAWNVSLWIGNDEGLYTLALDCLYVPCPIVPTVLHAFLSIWFVMD